MIGLPFDGERILPEAIHRDMHRRMATVADTREFVNALRARDRAAINRAAVQLLDERALLGDQWFSVAQVMVRNGEIELALASAERGAQEDGSAKSQFQLANILAMVGRPDDAIATISAIAPGKLNPIERDHFLGTCALEAGDFDLARNAFDRVVSAWGGLGVTWLSIAALPPTDDEQLLDRLVAARSTIIGTPADSRARWHYANGTVLDRLGRIDEAFDEFAAGAELVRSIRSYDREADRRQAEMLAAEYSSEAVDRIGGQVRADSNRPALVTGLPRSGTTLAEQILTNHSMIAGGGELPFGSIIAREIGGHSRPQLESFVAAHGADHLTRLYLHLGDQYFGEGQRFVDKCLGNSRALGVLAAILPQARIIWLRRDPLDCAWSCFRTFFSQGNEWSWSLTDIAAHFRNEDMLFSHWRGVLGERILTLSYEEFVANPKEQAGRIIAHLGLDAEPAMESAHQARRAVTTSSVTQVRQPVYQTAVGSSHRYRVHLTAFVEAYASEASHR